ncbi:MAG: hypothetical protein ACTTHI_01880 [Prevotella sp.]
MKIHYLYTMLITLTSVCFMSACSSNDDPIPVDIKKPQLLIDTDTLKVNVSESASFKIKEGGGEFKIFSENPEIASATLNNNTITVTSKEKGKTAVIISDKTGNYKRVPILSMYSKIILAENNVSITNKMGQVGYAKIEIKGGNGNYTAKSDDNNIAEISSINDVEVRLVLKKEGTTTVHITDMMGLQATINVEVKTTNIAYTEEEKEALKNSTVEHMTWDNEQWKPATGSSYKFYAKTKAGVCSIGWDQMWGSYVYGSFKVTYTGDLTEGIKAGAKLINDYDYPSVTYQLDSFEILKNDGTHIWAIYSVIKDGVLHYGKLCLALSK